MKTEKSTYKGVLQRRVLLLWFKRYAVLNGKTFSLFKDKNLKKVDIEVDIDPNFKIEPLEKEKPGRFKVSSSGNVLLHLEAESHDEMMRWIIYLRGCSYHTSKLTINDFNIISYIGKGFYGKVALVERKSTKEKYAIKIIKKRKLVQNNTINTVITERNILQMANHPFIVPLKFAFQTPVAFYIGLEYEPGGELKKLINSNIDIPLHDVKIYIAEIAIALEYLHDIGVVYRDLKPENILLDSEGHIKLTDFGLSKDMSQLGTKTSFSGTTEYLAPEICSHQPYGEAIDWWALGILMYELLFKVTPFTDPNKTQIYHNIVEKNPTFPNSASLEVVDLIQKLLNKDPKVRGTIVDVKMSKFFKDINFEDVYNRKVKPSFVPQVNDQIDNSLLFNSTIDTPDSGSGINANVLNFSYDNINLQHQNF